MIILGITGGSGCGKTTVSKILSENGVDVVDCDLVTRKIVEPNEPALREIEDTFGNEYLNSDKTLNRKKLAGLVFNSPENLLKLNKIMHKYVEEYINLYIQNSTCDIVGIDAAALIESGINKKCDYLLCVLANKDLRLQRIINRDNLSQDEALSRINAQKNDEFYIEKSDYIVYNNGNIDEINEQIIKILNEIRS
jgi:dephospho-CoA kinase